MTEETLGERIQRLREAHGLTKRDLSRKVGVSDVAVRYWETGESKTITNVHLLALAQAFGMTVSELLEDPMLPSHQANLLLRQSETIQKMADNVPYGIDAGEESAALERAAEHLYNEAQRLRKIAEPSPETSIS